ncbi:hypothetical protein BZA05DRAFT_421850 [Tricharina praecox]|uniref:uncharacterized protein n=1 Tax=Tricharina praecox TaxID=43433 RepID=UPI002220AD17|nr:uncharacterized protein BZA05DRAFT_421850 [Tricharina praecox]KAI5844340.1 hypothetical protein BZA05DRAFT_421850 [Tricharina praecox]
MPSFFAAGDGGNTTMTATTPAIETANPSKGRFSLFKKKSKTAEPAPLQLPPSLPPLQQVAPLTPPPAEEAPVPAPTPKPKNVTKKSSTDIDDELRRHLQREGYAFLAFSDPAKAAAHSNESPAEPAAGGVKDVVDPAESSRSHGTLLKDAVDLMEKKKSLETTRPTLRSLTPPANTVVPQSAPPQVAKAPVVLAAPQPNVLKAPAAAAARVENVFPKRVESVAGAAGAAFTQVPAAPGPSISGVGGGLRTTASRMAEKRPSSSRPPMPQQQQPSEGSIMDRKIVRKSSDQSNKDSGKDVDSHRSAGPSQRPSPVYPVEPPIGATAQRSAGPSRRSSPVYPEEPSVSATARKMVTESPAMARFAQEASMQDVDPRIHKNRRSGSHADQRQSRHGPTPEQMRYSTSGPSREYNQDQQYAPRPSRNSRQGYQLSMNPETRTQTPAMSDEERRQSDTSADESPRRNLPIPVMLSPGDYTSTLNRLQLNCEIAHRQTVISSNLHHRIICMVCRTDASSERWSCSYCALRFCSRCKSEFSAGTAFDEVLKKAASEDWRSQPAPPITPARGPGKNIAWELACVLEAGGRLAGYGYGMRQPPDGRRPPPPMRRRSPVHNSGGERSPVHRSGKSSPEQRVRSSSNQPPSPTYSVDRVKTSSRSSSSHRYAEGAVSPDSSFEDAAAGYNRDRKRRSASRAVKDGRNSGRCSPGLTNGTAAEQRRALLGVGLY